jgi:imidazolonepropionase-like amidohydrolase
MEAIISATQVSADCLGLLDEIGTLEEGKAADVLIINGNPAVDIKALHDVNTIVKQGQIVKQENELLI